MKCVSAFTALLWVVLGTACDQKKNEAAASPEVVRWKCHVCNEWHTDLPFSYGPSYPDPYLEIPEGERDKRAVLDNDFCIIDNKHHLIRGRLEIPVHGSKELFAWTVWVSLSKENFDRTIKLMETEGREMEPPYFGWLCTNLHLYPDTTNLKTHVHTQRVGSVPTIELEQTDHPLSVEQRNGITLDRVKEIAAMLLHPDSFLSSGAAQQRVNPSATQPQWTKADIAGLSIELIDPKAVESMTFTADGSLQLTVGEKNGLVTMPLLYWEVVSGRLRIASGSGGNQGYDEFTLVARDATTLTVRRLNGKIAKYKVLRK